MWLNFIALVGTIVVGILAPALLTIWIVYGRPAYRAFAIGAIFPAALLFAVAVCVIVVGVFDNDWDEFLNSGDLVSSFILAVFGIAGCGLFGAVTWRLFDRNRTDPQSVASFTRQSWQFSLGTLLALTGACSVAFALLFALPSLIAAGLLTPLALLVPVGLVELLIYGRPRYRPALIGAIFAATPLFCVSVVIFVVASVDDGWFRILGSDDLSTGLRIGSGVTWLAMLIVGGLCQLVSTFLRNDRSSSP